MIRLLLIFTVFLTSANVYSIDAQQVKEHAIKLFRSIGSIYSTMKYKDEITKDRITNIINIMEYNLEVIETIDAFDNIQKNPEKYKQVVLAKFEILLSHAIKHRNSLVDTEILQEIESKVGATLLL